MLNSISSPSPRLRLLVIAVVILAISLACTLPGAEGDTPSPETAVAETLNALASQTAADSTAAPESSPTATLTPEPSLSATNAVPIITVSVDTNCRVGPGNVYLYVGALLVGEQAEVLARDPSGNYWYIENPDKPGSYCWVWGEYATIDGDTSGLPVYTPPPTPTPTFTPTPQPNLSVEYHSVEQCVGWPIQFTILNNGGVTWESISIVITDEDTAFTTNTVTYNDFTERNNCLDGASHYDRLDPGVTGYATSYDLNQHPAGHTITGTVTVCMQDNLGGFCMSQDLFFIAP